MFISEYRYSGDHALMTDDLLIEHGGIFETVYDVFFSAAIIGFIKGEKSQRKGDRSNTKTIWSDKFLNEVDKTILIIRTLLLANPDLDSEELGRVDRALRSFSDKEIEKLNREYIESYALRGIEILHDEFISNKDNTDVVSFVNDLKEKYTNKKNSFESIQSLILELSKTQY